MPSERGTARDLLRRSEEERADLKQQLCDLQRSYDQLSEQTGQALVRAHAERGSKDALNFYELRAQNASRKLRWHGNADEWTGADWSNAMQSEAGEAGNIVKKLRRHETHTGTAYNTPAVEDLLPALAEEIADTVIYADLLAEKYGIDLGRAVREKFNRVSEAQDFPERL